MTDDKKKKKRPDDPIEESQEEVRPDSELTEGEDGGTRIDPPEEQQTFFSFTGQLRDYEVLPPSDDATQTDVSAADMSAGPSEPEPDTAETDSDSPAGPQTQQTQAGPVRDDDPAASPSASQAREAAGPADFSDATHTDIPDLSRPPQTTPTEDSDSTQTDLSVTGRARATPPEQLPDTETREPPLQAGRADDWDRPVLESTQTEVPGARAKSHELRDQTSTDAWGRPLPDATQTDLTPRAEPRAHDLTQTDVYRKDESGESTQTDVYRKPETTGERTQTDVWRHPQTVAPEDATASEVRPVTDETVDAPAPDATRPRTLGPDDVTRTKEPAETAPAPDLFVPTQPVDPDDETGSIDFPGTAGRTRTDLGSLGGQGLPLPGQAPFTQAPLFDVPAPPAVEPPDPEEEEKKKLLLTRRPRRERVQRPTLAQFFRGLLDAYHPKDLARKLAQVAGQRFARLTSRAKTVQAARKLERTAEWWRRTLVEVGVLYAIVIPIELAVTKGQIGSFGVHPHPYWLIVLPMAAARGLVAGLITASVASVLYAVGAMRAIGSGEDVFTYANMMEPILFWAVGFFAGEVHDEMELRRRKVERRLDDLQERTTRLRQERDVLMDANRELEKRIVDDSAQFGNLIAAARRIEKAGRNEIFELALEMVEEHCGSGASVLIVIEDGSLDYLAHRGWADDELSERLSAARESQYVARAIADGVRVSGFEPGETPPAKGPLVVAPLFDARGVVKALLCLDHVPVIRLNESTVTLFLGIAEWVSAALGRLARDEAPAAPRERALTASDAGGHVGTQEELGKRLRLELSRCSRYGVPTSFLTIQAVEWTDTSGEGVEVVDRYIAANFTRGLRPSDTIYRFGYPGCYLLVLAGTSVQGAEVVRTRLLRRIEYGVSQPVGAIEVTATGPDAEAPDLISLAERCAARFRRFSSLPLEGRCPIEVPDAVEVGDIEAFRQRLKLETSLAIRNGFDLHVAGISADRPAQGTGLLARHVLEAGAQTLRPTDGVFAIGPYHCAIVLPCTNGEEAATVVHRVATLVRARDPDAPYGALETTVLGLGPVHPDADSFLRALARRSVSGGGA